MSKINNRRIHVSFKNNNREDELLAWLEEKSKILGTSTYIKLLIERDMNSKKEEE